MADVNLSSQEFADLTSQFSKKLMETCKRLNMTASKAIILLVQYEWDVNKLVRDYEVLLRVGPLMDQIVDANDIAPSSHVICDACDVFDYCLKLNCVHNLCADCLRDSVLKLPLLCPVEDCQKFINFCNLPQDLKEQYLSVLLLDLKKNRKKGIVGLVVENKEKFAALFSVLACGYAFYRTRQWQIDNPCTTFLMKTAYSAYKGIGEFNKVLEKAWNSS